MHVMTGPLILLAALASPIAQPVPAVTGAASMFRPTGGAGARATASIRIVAGAKFGAGRPIDAPGASVRLTRVADTDGRPLPAKLLEFQ